MATNTATRAASAPSSNITGPSVIEWNHLRFVLMDAPNDFNIKEYISELKKNNVVHVIRLCEEVTYAASNFDGTGIDLHAWPFPDGDPPPQSVIAEWMSLVHATMTPNKAEGKHNAIALHCVAGLGRSPVMAAIALIEYGLDWQNAVDLIRKKRRGAINRKQLKYLETYTPQSAKNCCIIC